MHPSASFRMWTRRIRFNNFPRRTSMHPSPAFVPLTILRGLGGVAFICFGEFFWMHLHRVELEADGKVLGWMLLALGIMMVFGAVMSVAGLSFSQDEGCRMPLLFAVYLSAPLSMFDFVAFATFLAKRSRVVRLDREHTKEHWRPPPGPGEDVVSPDRSFRQMYDFFIFLVLAFTVLEALMFRLGRRRLMQTAGNRSSWMRNEHGVLSAEPLQSLLDEEDLKEAGWEERLQTSQQNLSLQQRYEQLRRAQLEKSEGLLEHTRGGNLNNSL